MKRKRVEYQKYIRTKLEQERYRELFGMTDNITLEGEEDLVLQREFRLPVRLPVPSRSVTNGRQVPHADRH